MIKNKWIATLCIIALFIPSMFAVIAYVNTGKAPTLEMKTIQSMEMRDLSGDSFEFDKKDGKEVIELFVNMNKSAISVGSLPDQLIGADFFLVKYKTTRSDVEYKYYFSLDSSPSYYTDGSGLAYQIDKKDVSKFAETVYAHSLYAASDVPSLTISHGESVIPSSLKWYYLSDTGNFIESGFISDTASDLKTYQMDGGIGLNFTIAPDYLYVKARDESGEILFDDLYENMSGLNIPSESGIRFDVVAKWYEDDAREYYGEIEYSFIADISAPAIFHLGETTLEPGYFTVITGINIGDVSKVKFASEPALICQGEEFTPVFYADGEYVRALIPTDYATDVEKYTFTLSYGASSQELTLNIKAKKFGSSTYHVTSSVAAMTYTDSTVAAFKNAMQEITEFSSETRMWSGKFSPATKENTVTIGFGRYVEVSSTEQEFRHEGVDYYAPKGTEVLAVNAGTVVYVGAFDYPGKMIVIDHGMGLKSWYAHLDEINVEVGDKVETGEAIALAGTSGFASSSANHRAVHVTLSVFGVPVCPYTAEESGIPMYGE
jgi:hypothetical protein